MDDWINKLDVTLRRLLVSGNVPDSIYLLIQHTGALDELSAHGLRNATSIGSTLAVGTVEAPELEGLASLDQVVAIQFGVENQPDLFTSVPDIKADQVWSLNRSTGAFSGAGETGDGVVIGIIDTGIDVTHKDFLETGSPLTRIKRVWDQGLTPKPGESSPAVARLAPGTATSYGVEISDTEINAEISGGPEVRHADCDGHGTHVASIASGIGTADGVPTRNVGVAPKAQLVIVKAFALAEQPAAATQQFLDAIHYILNVAKHDLGDKPVVINLSAGSATGPHDGLESMDIALTELFRGKQGQIFVTTTGNAARQDGHARITIPPGGSIDVPFIMSDTRTLKVDNRNCSMNSNTISMQADLWYPDVAGVSVQLKLPGDAAFRATSVARGGADFLGTFDGAKNFHLSHAPDTSIRPAEPGLVPPLAQATVTRSQINLLIEADGDDHATGRYELRISGPEGTVIEGWTSPLLSNQNLKFVSPAPSGVTIRDEHDQMNSPGAARHLVTVAAYADQAITLSGVSHAAGDVAFFSSRGNVMDYAGIGGFPDKPDISAPGVEINAAHSSTTINPVFRGLFDIINRYRLKSGTSMAAPHVTGVIALMLQKEPKLTVDQVLAVLKTVGQGARAASPSKDFGAGRVDAKGAVDNVP